MAKSRSRKSASAPAVTDRRMREILTAILTGKLIPPPDAKGWDAAALIVTASIMATRALTLTAKGEASGRPTRRKSPRKSR